MNSQQRHLKELLKEDQEPFHLTNYIAHKKNPSLTNQQTLNLQLKKNKKNPIKQNASFPSHFCKNACFFSKFHVDSPDYLRKSPLLSPAAFGNKSPNHSMFLHVPAKTAALLLEAACRVQKNSTSTHKKIKPKTQLKNSGFGLLGSVFKRLTNRSRTRKIETGEPADDVIRWADSVKTTASTRDEIRVGSEVGLVEKSDLVEDQTGFSNGRLSSVWSEENKSLPSSSSSSSTCCSRSASGNLSEEDREEKIGSNATNVDQDFTFCLSPPFRFSLQKSPSTGCRSPAFCSPAGSPSRRKFQEHVKYEEQDQSVKFEDEEEEKEQCSPVSILDPPFGDDDDDCEEEETDEADFDMECSYAFVQRAKHNLLQKLRKFEKLAELDPVELEKRMVEEEDEDEDVEYEADNEEDDVDVQSNIEGYLYEIAKNSGLVEDLVKPGMKRLLSDLIIQEEKTEPFGANYDSLIKRVCKRLESSKEVEPNTIEMMVAMDLKGQYDIWNNPKEEISQTVKMVEFSIFATLLEDFVDEVITS